MKTRRLTMAQALVRFLANQYIVIDDQEQRFVHGIWGIFGHGNVTGIGEALEFDANGLTYYQGHNEQGMAHAAIAFAKQKNRLGIFACTSSIGPGATNMITAAATATTNRIPLLLLPGDIFACRQPDPVLQQLEVAHDHSISVNDCFKPVSKYWDRIVRPEQLMSACLNAFRVLTDPAETGAVTLCLPQDVQAESYDYLEYFFAKRLWYIDRTSIAERPLKVACEHIKNCKQPLLIAGGGVHYSLAAQTLVDFAEKHKIPVAETQAGKSALPWIHPYNVGGIGVTGSEAANRLAEETDLLLVVGSRLQDFTTSSKWAFKNPHLKIIHLNINSFDSHKMNALSLKGDAKLGLEQLSNALGNFQTTIDYQDKIKKWKQSWQEELKKVYTSPNKEKLYQTSVIGILNDFVTADDVIVTASGSLPGDLQRLWCSKQPKDYHLEYAYSCMGYEVAGGLGIRMAKENDSGEVYVLVGDGSYLMLHSELLTSIQENKKITVIVFDNHGYQCIRNLQEAHGSNGFGNEFRFRNPKTNQLDGQYIPINFCQYAAALGAKTFYADSEGDLQTALKKAKQESSTCVIVLAVLPKTMSQGYNAWWRVGIAEVSESVHVQKAFADMCEQLEKVIRV